MKHYMHLKSAYDVILTICKQLHTTFNSHVTNVTLCI